MNKYIDLVKQYLAKAQLWYSELEDHEKIAVILIGVVLATVAAWAVIKVLFMPLVLVAIVVAVWYFWKKHGDC